MQSVLVLGGSGLVGSRLLQLWQGRFELRAPTHAELNVLDVDALAAVLKQTQPNTVVNLAAWADVDGAEAQRDDVHGLAYRLNATHPGALAQLCGDERIHLLHVSTDYVFDGTNDRRAYREDDPTNPLGWYARTKAVGEQLIGNTGAEACIARIEMPFTAQAHAKLDFARMCLTRLRGGQTIAGVTDQRITPVFLDDAAEAVRRLIELRVTGTVHVASTSWTTPYDFARAIASRLGLDEGLIQPQVFERFASTRTALRPRHCWLDVARASSLLGSGVLRTVDEQLDRWSAQARDTRLASGLVR